MLFKEVHLRGIQSGTVSLAFRKWKKSSVKKGSLIKTAIGLVKVVDLAIVSENKITASDAVKAGFKNREQLLKSLRRNDDESIYKLSVRYHSEDPRIRLREQTELTHKQFYDLRQKLQRLDKFSRQGAWTIKVLTAIKDHPQLHAAGIAAITGFEKEWLKLHIRKLKNVGLTMSHNVGYELSPLGKVLMEKLCVNE